METTIHQGMHMPPEPPAYPPPPPLQPPLYHPAATYVAAAAVPGNGIGVAAGVMGIVGLVLSFIPVLDFAGAVLAVLAVVFGAVGIHRAKTLGGASKGMAVTGLVCGVVALAIAFWFIAVLFSASAALHA